MAVQADLGELEVRDGEAWGEDELIPSGCQQNSNRFLSLTEDDLVLEVVGAVVENVVGPICINKDKFPIMPGNIISHYAPKKRLILGNIHDTYKNITIPFNDDPVFSRNDDSMFSRNFIATYV